MSTISNQQYFISASAESSNHQNQDTRSSSQLNNTMTATTREHRLSNNKFVIRPSIESAASIDNLSSISLSSEDRRFTVREEPYLEAYSDEHNSYSVGDFSPEERRDQQQRQSHHQQLPGPNITSVQDPLRIIAQQRLSPSRRLSYSNISSPSPQVSSSPYIAGQVPLQSQMNPMIVEQQNNTSVSNISHSVLPLVQKRDYERKILELERRITELSETIKITHRIEQQAKDTAANEAELNRQQRFISKKLSSTVSEQIYQIELLEQEIQLLKDSNKEKDKKVEKLEQEVETKDKLHSEEIEEWKKKLGKINMENKRLLALVQKKQDTDSTHFDQIISQKESLVAELKQNIVALEMNNKDLELRVRELTTESELQRAEKIAKDKIRSALEAERDRLKLQLSNLQAEFKSFEKEFMTIRVKYDEFLNNYKTILNEMKELKKETRKKDLRIQSLEMRLSKQLSVTHQDQENNNLRQYYGMESAEMDKEPLKKDGGIQTKHEDSFQDDLDSTWEFKGRNPWGVSPEKVKKLMPYDKKLRYSLPGRTKMNTELEDDNIHTLPFVRKSIACITKEDVEKCTENATNNDMDQQQDVPFYKDAEYLKKRLATERKRVELKNIEIAGLKEMLFHSLKNRQKPVSSTHTRSPTLPGDTDILEN